MKKLKLDLDTLAVESYATHASETPSGTVAAHSEGVAVVVLTIAATYAAAKTLTWA